MRRCASGHRCRDLEILPDGSKHPHTVTTDPGLCAECVKFLRHTIIGHLLDDYDALHTLMREHQTGATEHVSYTPNPSIPLAVDPERLMVDLAFYASTAAEMLSDHLNLEPPEPSLESAQQRLAPYVEKLTEVPSQAVVVWVTGEATDVPVHEWVKVGPKRYRPVDADGREIIGKGRVSQDMSGVDLALKMWTLHELTRGAFGARPKDQRDHMATPCHWCGYRSLYRDHGADLIYCSRCPKNTPGAVGYTRAKYDELLKRSEFYMKVLRQQELEVVTWLLAEKDHRAAVQAWLAAERLWQLEQITRFAGHPSIEELLAVVEKASA